MFGFLSPGGNTRHTVPDIPETPQPEPVDVNPPTEEEEEIDPKYLLSDVMSHIIHEILLEKVTPGPILDALVTAGYDQPFHFAVLDPDELVTSIDALTFRTQIPSQLRLVDRKNLKDLQSLYFELLVRYGKPVLDDDDWFDLDHNDLLEFQLLQRRQNAAGSHSFEGQPSPSTPSPSYSLTPTPGPSQPGNQFENNHRVKRDPHAYAELKEDRFYESWIQQVEALAGIHGCEMVLDSTYEPSTYQETMEFKSAQTFMWAVLSSKLKTSTGKMYMRQNKKDPQAVFRLLDVEYNKSLKAEYSAEDLLEKINDLDIKKWDKTYVSFMEHWAKLMDRYLDLTANSEAPLTAGEKKKMLKRAVSGSESLAALVTNENIEKQKGNSPWSYEVYFDLLMTTALEDDRKMKRTGKTNRNRSVNATQQTGKGKGGGKGKDGDRGNDGSSWRVDKELWTQLPAPAQQVIRNAQKKANIQVKNAARESLGNIRLPDTLWQQLPPQAKRALSKHNSRNSGNPGRNPQQQTPPQQVSNPPTQRAANSMEQAPVEDSQNQVNPPSNNSQPMVSSMLADDQTVPSANPPIMVHQGVRYRRCNLNKIVYHVSNQQRKQGAGSLIDSGANGGFAGSDVLVLSTTDRYADVSGIDDHTVTNIPICTVAGKIRTIFGDAIGIFHQYAYSGKGRTIHAPTQLEHHGLKVDEKSVHLGGSQRIDTPEGFVIPLDFKDGLSYMPMSKPTDEDMGRLPHIIFTSDEDWDPSVLDHIWPEDLSDIGEFSSCLETDEEKFDGYDDRVTLMGSLIHPDDDEDPVFENTQDRVAARIANPHKVKMREQDYVSLIPKMGWMPLEVVKKTIEKSTQWFRNIYRLPMRKHFKSRFPRANVHSRMENVAFDKVISDTPAHKSGVKQAAFFVGTSTRVKDVYPMRSEKQFPKLMEDNIRERGAPLKFISDNAQAFIGQRVKEILRLFCIKDYQSEPHNQWQNDAEGQIGVTLNATNRVMDRSGCPPCMWLLALQFVVTILNFTANEGLGWDIPEARLTGVTTDSSLITQFEFYEDVYYAVDDHWPSVSKERGGKFVGFALNKGDALTFKVMDDETEEVLTRSVVRPRNDGHPNRRVWNPLEGEDDPDSEKSSDPSSTPIQYVRYESSSSNGSAPAPDPAPDPAGNDQRLSPDELIGRSFVLEEQEDGSRPRAEIVKKIIELDKENEKEIIKFLVSVPEGKMDQIRDYHDLLAEIEKQTFEDEDGEVYNLYLGIEGHHGPLERDDPAYKGSRWNALVKWEDGSSTWEPLHILAKDMPDVCAEYAIENQLLDEDGWKQFRRRAKNKKVAARRAKQFVMAHKKWAPIFMYGVEVPRDSRQARILDEKNGNTLWQDAEYLEISQLMDYDFAKDHGHGDQKLEGYQKIRCRMVYAVKHDGRHKARFVAGGHLTKDPESSVYSSVVNIRSLRIILLAAELNDLELQGADVGNAYLEALTHEKIYFIAGEEFAPFGLEGHTLVLYKALYGLKSSGYEWGLECSKTLKKEGFFPSRADPQVWMRMNKEYQVWEYVCVYVDDLCLAMKNPKELLDKLRAPVEQGGYGYKLKGDGPLTFHLGCDYFRDKDGRLVYQPKKYIEKMKNYYERTFGENPRKKGSPMKDGDHPEIDDSPECDEEERKIYLSMIGQLQWLITLGRFDIMTAVNSMSSFRCNPRKGHLDRLKNLYGYVLKFKDAAVTNRIQVPNYSHLDEQDEPQDWENSVYGGDHEEFPDNMPVPLGKLVRISAFVDANLYFDLANGRACTGILLFVNQTPVDWYSKKQATVATATFGSEFVAAKTCAEKIYDLRYTLRMFGIPLDYRSYMFGDNESVVTQGTIPHSQLSKRHHALAYHYVREAISTGAIRFFHMSGKENPADCLTKFLGYQVWYPLLKPILFHRGNTGDISTKGEWQASKKAK